MGAASELLTPLVDQIRKHVLAAAKIHADDTPVPVLAPGNGKTRTGRLWTYVRDDRPAGFSTAPAVWFAYSEDRKGEHPRRHLKDFKGALQGYSIRRCEKCRHGSRPHVQGGFRKETTTLNEAVNVESYRWNCDKEGLAEAFSHSPPSYPSTRVIYTYSEHSVLELMSVARCWPGERRTLSPPNNIAHRNRARRPSLRRVEHGPHRITANNGWTTR